VEQGLSIALTGLGHLLLSPLQIAVGLLEGIAPTILPAIYRPLTKEYFQNH